MVKNCAWGICRSDTRYPERLAGGVRFIPFPRWKKTQPSNREKCLRWIKACNRPHEQLNLSLVEKSYNYYICTKHFLDGAPSERYPDPVVATAASASEEQLHQGSMKPSRPRQKDRSSSCSEPLRKRARKTLAVSEPAVEEMEKDDLSLSVMPEVKIEIDVAEELPPSWMSQQLLQVLQEPSDGNMSRTELRNPSDSQTVPSDQTAVLVKQEPSEDHVTDSLFLQEKTEWKPEMETKTLQLSCTYSESSDLKTEVKTERKQVEQEPSEDPLPQPQHSDCKSDLRQEREEMTGSVNEGLGGEERPYSCQVCGAAFAQRWYLKKIHMRKHTGECPYACQVCSATFTTSGNLNTHMRKHTGERPYSCQMCSATFSLHQHLKRHMHKHTGERPYSCQVCSAAFVQHWDLKTHMRKHTGERPYSCQVCSATFSQLQHSKTHMRKHTGERPYSCQMCSATFSQLQHLKTHMRKHTGERPYSCQMCSATFLLLQHLKIHMRKHTG